MPQEFQVLQCFNCETFQVDIVKKNPKWTCKLCNEKQSIKKIYGKGTAKECRVFVHSLNEQRLSKQNYVPLECEHIELESFQSSSTVLSSNDRKSKWAEFTKNTAETFEPNDVNFMATEVLTSSNNSEKTFEDVFEDKNNDLDSFLDL